MKAAPCGTSPLWQVKMQGGDIKAHTESEIILLSEELREWLYVDSCACLSCQEAAVSSALAAQPF